MLGLSILILDRDDQKYIFVSILLTILAMYKMYTNNILGNYTLLKTKKKKKEKKYVFNTYDRAAWQR